MAAFVEWLRDEARAEGPPTPGAGPPRNVGGAALGQRPKGQAGDGAYSARSARALPAVAVDRSVRAPRSAPAPPCSISPAAPAVTRASSPAAVAGCSRSIVTPPRSRAMQGVAGIKTRLVDLEAPTWPLAGERFDADRRRQLPAPAAVAGSRRDARRRRRAALRDVRPRQRGVRASVESGFPARARRAAARLPVHRSPWSRSNRAMSPWATAVPSCSGLRRSGGGVHGRRRSLRTPVPAADRDARAPPVFE